jgi:hypothetical protein
VQLGWLEAGAVLVIGLSLALKLAVLDVAVAEDQNTALRDLQSAIAAQGYTASVPRADLPIVRGDRAGCSFTARVLDPHGLFRDTELLKLPKGWAVQYGWRGGWTADLPRLGPLVEYYLARQVARFGVESRHAPVIMLSHAPGCPELPAETVDIRIELRRAQQR